MGNSESEVLKEKEILERVHSDDDTGFDLMVDAFAPMIYRYALRMCGNVDEAEDILQDTFLTAKEKIEQFRGEGRLRNWLFTIAGNTCRQRQRKLSDKKRNELNIDDVLPSYDDSIEPSSLSWRVDPVKQILNEELKERLESAIAALPAPNRSVLILRDMEGLSTRETANAMDITEETVKVRLHRARAFVRNKLRDYFEGNQ